MTDTLTPETTPAYRLSPPQRRLWRLQEMAGGALDTVVVAHLEGPLEAASLRRAVEATAEDLEILRTRPHRVHGMKVPLQRAADGAVDWRRPDQKGAGDALQAVLSAVARDAAAEGGEDRPPLRAALAPATEGEGHLLALAVPALLADATSAGLLVSEVARRYAGLEADEEPVQYRDVAAFQNELLEGEETEEGRQYWADQRLDRVPPVAPPLLRRQPPSVERRAVEVPLEEGLPAALAKRCSELDIPIGAFLLAAWQVLLWRHQPQPRGLLGVTFDGRSYEGLEGVVGALARSVPWVSPVDGGEPFRDLARRSAEALEEAQDYQEFFDWSAGGLPQPESGEPLLPVGFHFAPWPRPVQAGGLRWTLAWRHAPSDLHPLELRAAVDDESAALRAELVHDPAAVGEAEADLLARGLAALLADAVARPGIPVERLELMAEDERRRILHHLDAGTHRPTGEACVHHRFEEQAAATPDAPAVTSGGETLTYRELLDRSRRVADALRRRGVGPEVRVALAVERGCDLLVGLLGALRAGGAYVPLDPALPRERLQAMLDASGSTLLLTQERLRDRLPATLQVFALDGDEAAREAADGSEEPARPGTVADHLAYVLFTSGSTGTPKGVMVTHRQLLHYVEHVGDRLRLPDQPRFALASTLAADLGNTALFPTLAAGGCVHVLTADEVADPDAFARAMAGVDCLKIVPSHLQALLSAGDGSPALPRRRLVLGGEAADPRMVARLRDAMPEGEVYNHYGPTETTVGVLAGRFEPGEEDVFVTGLPLGRPIGGSRISLVDRHLQPVPPWVAGELLVGGPGVARGYIGRPAATAERFLPDPWSDRPGARLYRTGDLVRARSDGRLEFLGRIDNQVKLRGFRIELGEVETHLRRLPGIAEAVAGLHRDEAGGERLVAWIVPAAGSTGGDLEDAEMRHALAARLPEVMVPSAFVRLEALPLNANGKVDRSSLPEPQAVSADAEYAPPRNPQEEVLARIWSDLLPVERIGIHDNFFRVGGDSILSIQVIARANQEGIHLTANQIFDHQTIAELAAVAEQAVESVAEQGPVVGPAPLTPIQHRFFSQRRRELHHFNQSALLTAPPDLSPTALRRAWTGLASHHDALRLRFHQGDDGWQQHAAEPPVEVPLLHVDLGNLGAEALEAAWNGAVARLQAGLEIGEGPLVRLGWGDRGDRRPGRLLVAVHHLVIDGVSWRVLLEDLETAYRQAFADEAVELPAKTTSYKSWGEHLEGWAESAELTTQAEHWRQVLADRPALPVDRSEGPNDEASTAAVSMELDEAATRALLAEVHDAYNTRTSDLLLAALGETLADWTGRREAVLSLEGHGREDALFEGMDLSRTVGWFTAVYPVRLHLPETADQPGELLRGVKEQLRAVPDRGLGYGVLRHLSAGAAGERVRSLDEPEVVFNYLGQFDGAAGQESIFAAGGGTPGHQRGGRGARPHLLEVVALVRGGRLHCQWIYSRHRHRRDSVEALAESFRDHLRRLLEHCASPQAGGRTPSDFPLVDLDQARLDQVLGDRPRQVEDLYPLTPMQQSLLLFGLQNPGAGIGVEQTAFTLCGELDTDAFWRAWQWVVDRHTALRTRFAWQGVPRPLQAVMAKVDLPRVEEDWRGLDEAEQGERLGAFMRRDRARGFDFSQSPLMRIALIRLREDRWRFVSTRHHAVVDGWSSALLLREGFERYQALRQPREATPAPAPAPPYRRYVEWLERQELGEAESFWRLRLLGFEEPGRLGIGAAGGGGPGTAHRKALQLSASATEALETFARRQLVTLNTLVQGAWALLLSRYDRRRRVLFGHAVSGRPPGLPDVESMVGLFINNQPVPVLVEGDTPLGPWLEALQEQQLAASAYEHVPPERLHEWSEVPRSRRLFDSLLVFENYPIQGQGEASGDGDEQTLRMEDFEAPVQTGYRATLVVVPGRRLALALTYDPQLLEADEAQAVLDGLETLLAALPGGADTPLSALLERVDDPPRRRDPAAADAARRGEPVPPRNEVEAALVAIFEEILEVSPLGVEDDFYELGGTSFVALGLTRRIHERLGAELPLAALVGGATVARLAQLLERDGAVTEGAALVPLRPGGAKAPFFCVHSAGGMIVNLVALSRHLDADRPFYALRDPALGGGAPVVGGVGAMAEAYLREVREVQPQGPYHLGGHSFGGLVAFAMARYLAEAGEEVGAVALLDSSPPGSSRLALDDVVLLTHIGEMFARFYGREPTVDEAELRELPPDDRLERVLDELRAAGAGADAGEFAQFYELYKAHLSAASDYRPSPADLDLTLFQARDGEAGDESGEVVGDGPADPGWERLTRVRLSVVTVPGDHTTMLRSPHVEELATELARLLDTAEPGGGE